MDEELFKLCKEVYEKTGLKDTKTVYRPMTAIKDDPLQEWEELNMHPDQKSWELYDFVPLYTSDYLLEKLPVSFERKSKRWWLNLSPEISYGGIWVADYQNDKPKLSLYIATSDSPLKALLKLTLALADAGELTKLKDKEQ